MQESFLLHIHKYLMTDFEKYMNSEILKNNCNLGYHTAMEIQIYIYIL